MIKLSSLLTRIWEYCRRQRHVPVLALRLCGKAFRDLWMDGGFTQAAAISYYLIVSIFPMLFLVIGIVGYFLEPQNFRQEVLGWLSQYFPEGTRAVFRENIQAIIDKRSFTSILGAAILLWSCTLLFDAINQAVNAAWGMRGNSRFFTDKLKSLVLICLIVIAAMFSTFLTTRVALVPKFEALLEKYPSMDWVLNLSHEAATLTGTLIPFLISVCAFGLAYRLLPRVRITFRDVWPAAVVTAILWELSKTGFVLYFTKHAEYTEIYGSISAVLVLMVWAYVSSLILAWGAELTSEIWKERRKIELADREDYPFIGIV
jgi:membrane protein